MKTNTVQTALAYAVIGTGIGAVVCTISLLVSCGMTDILKQISVWLIASAVIGLVSLVYESENLTDITATLIHAPVTLLVALICGWILDYGDGSFALLVMRMLPVIVIMYAAIHLILFLLRRSAARALNDHLKK